MSSKNGFIPSKSLVVTTLKPPTKSAIIDTLNKNGIGYYKTKADFPYRVFHVKSGKMISCYRLQREAVDTINRLLALPIVWRAPEEEITASLNLSGAKEKFLQIIHQY